MKKQLIKKVGCGEIYGNVVQGLKHGSEYNAVQDSMPNSYQSMELIRFCCFLVNFITYINLVSSKQVFDEDIGDDKRLGVAKLPLIELEAETAKEIELRLLPSLDMLKIKDKKDRGTLLIQVNILYVAGQ